MPFNNPIVGGTALVRPAINSPNYTPGSLGWTINADGTAEFNGATFRGTIIEGVAGGLRVEIGPGGTIHFFNASNVLVGTLQPNSYDLTGTAGQSWVVKLSSGNVVQLMQPAPGGALTYGPGEISSIGSGGNPVMVIDSPTVVGHPPAEIQLIGENLAPARIAASPIYALIGGAGGAVEIWNPITPLNGFSNRSPGVPGFPVFSYRAVATPANDVEICGQLVSGATVASGTQIGAVPVGYRPATEMILDALNLSVPGNKVFVAIESTGVVSLSGTWANGNIIVVEPRTYPTDL